MDDAWISLSQAVKLTAQRLDLTDRLARQLLLNDAFPNGVGFGGDKEVRHLDFKETDNDARGLLSLSWSIWTEPQFTEINPNLIKNAEIDWEVEKITFPADTPDSPPNQLLRLRVCTADLKAWLSRQALPGKKQEGANRGDKAPSVRYRRPALDVALAALHEEYPSRIVLGPRKDIHERLQKRIKETTGLVVSPDTLDRAIKRYLGDT
jgi:hypothetical protein